MCHPYGTFFFDYPLYPQFCLADEHSDNPNENKYNYGPIVQM